MIVPLSSDRVVLALGWRGVFVSVRRGLYWYRAWVNFGMERG